VAFALAALPCASKAQIIIDQCLLHAGRLIVNASPAVNVGAISSGAGSSVLDVTGGTGRIWQRC
jgi:hypothetical protein